MEHVFSIIQPKNSSYLLPMAIVIPLLLVIIGVLFGLILGLKNSKLIVTDTSLIIKSPVYGKTIPLTDIDRAGIRFMNIDNNDEYQLTMRWNGIGMPGYKSGWFKLKNGQKALVFITDTSRVLMIPTRDYPILFSSADGEEIMELLK